MSTTMSAEPVMGFGEFLVLFLAALWIGGVLEWLWNQWRGKR